MFILATPLHLTQSRRTLVEVATFWLVGMNARTVKTARTAVLITSSYLSKARLSGIMAAARPRILLLQVVALEEGF